MAKDPVSGVYTTYVPIFYLNEALKFAGFKSTYNGQSWGLTAPISSSTSVTASLSNIAVSNQSNGTGTKSSPAVALNGTAILLSTTLTDASGNPIPNTAVTFEVSNYGTVPNQLPIVENASGTVIPGTSKSTYEAYTIYTNNHGMASISVNASASGKAFAYEVVATAPYATGSPQTALSTQPVYVEYVSSNYAVFAPYATFSQPFVAPYTQVVPVSIILPPNTQGKPQANVLLTLQAQTTDTSGNSASTSSPYYGAGGEFMSSRGVDLGTKIQVTTNSAGIAHFYVGNVTTTPTGYLLQISVDPSSLPIGVNAPKDTYFNFAQNGIPSQINNFSISSTTSNIGQNVYVSGQLEDASGNPVPNGQILIASPNVSTDLYYVNGSTTTIFPSMMTALNQNTPANSAYGDLVTADANGNFSFAMWDNDAETQTYIIYPVSNEEIAGAPITTGVPTSDESITFNYKFDTTLDHLSIGRLDSYVRDNDDSSLTGLIFQVDNGFGGLGQLISATDSGSNSQIADVYVEPQNQDGNGGNLNEPENYILSVSNGGLVYSINCVTLDNPSSAVAVNYTPASGTVGIDSEAGTAYGTYTVNGQTIYSMGAGKNKAAYSTTQYTGLGTSVNAAGALPEDFEIGVVNSHTGATTLTIQSGSVSSTASIIFQSGAPDQVASFTPEHATVQGSQAETVTFQVKDYTGNPVPNVPTTVETDTSTALNDPMWVTQVNGITLKELLNMGNSNSTIYETEITPIPLGPVPSALNYNVSMQGVVQWTNPGSSATSSNITVFSDANGNVTLTLQAGGLSYPTQYLPVSGIVNANQFNAALVPTGTRMIQFYTDSNGDTNPGIPVLFIGGNAPTASQLGAVGSQISAGPNNDAPSTVAGNFTVQGTLNVN